MAGKAVDVAIIGAGPAALTAAIYAARAGRRTQLYARGNFGGALTEISQIKNYPGFLGSGEELAEIMVRQAKESGAELLYGECTEVTPAEGGFELVIDGEREQARMVLVATGSEPKPLEIGDLRVPVSYCAMCDADLVKGKKVAVVGGGNSAVQEALYLAKIAKEVTIITHSRLKAQEILVKELAEAGVKVLEETEVTKDLLEKYEHIFVFVGKRPASGFVKNLGVCDEDSYVVAENGHMTKEAGLFVAGDIRAGATRQAITAAADGAMAAIEMMAFLG